MKALLLLIFSAVQFYCFSQQTHFDNLDSAFKQPQNVRSLRLINYSTTINSLPEDFLKFTELNSLYIAWGKVVDYTQIFNMLSQLPNLKKLEINNYADSILPPSIGKMKQLQYLKIRTEKLTMLPPEIEGMVSLEELEIDALGLRKALKIPKEIGKLDRLKRLDLGRCDIEILPLEIGDLSSLEELNLWGNELSNLPATIGQLSNLKSLALASNRFDSIPKEIFNLTSLEELYLSGNRLTYLDGALTQLSNLKGLYLGDNIGIMSLPENINELTKLEQLDIEGTQIVELPLSLKEIKSLKRIAMCSTFVKNVHTINRNFKNVIDWGGYCKDLERLKFDFEKKYGTTTVWMHRLGVDTVQLHYKFNYNEPNSVDEEYTRYIVLRFAANKFKEGEKISIPDSSIIIFASSLSMSHWGDYYDGIQGQLTFLKINKNKISVQLNLIRKNSDYEYTIVDNKRLIFRRRNKKPIVHNVMGLP